MPETLLLRTFLAVAAECSFRKAAQALHVAPSTVTSRVMALEDELGARLFDRRSRSVALTEAGQRLFWHASRLTELAAATRRVVLGGDEACEVRLRVSETLGALCLPPVLGRLREVHPAARVQVTTASREGVAADLRRGNVDVALVLGEPFAAPGVTVETLGREELVVCTVPGGPLSGLGEAGPDDLADAPLVLTRRVWSARPLMERALAGCGEGMAGGVECSSAAIVRRCVLAGLGVSVLPRFFVAEDARRGRITIVPWRGEALFATVFAARDRVRTPPAPVAAFLRLTREFFAARDAMRLTENRH